MDEETIAQIRRYSRNIQISGIVVIVYGIWSIIKFIAPIFFDGSNIAELMGIDEAEFEHYGWVAMAVILLVLSLIFWAHYAIGSGALKYASGKKKSRGFFIGALVFFIITVISMAQYFKMINGDEEDVYLDELLTSIMMDLTFLFVLFDLMRSTYKVNKLRKLEENEK